MYDTYIILSVPQMPRTIGPLKPKAIYRIMNMLMIMPEKAKECKCQKCGYVWKPRVKEPRECPDCKSRRFSVPNTEKH